MNEFTPHTTGPIAYVLELLLKVFEYDEAVVIKNVVTDVSAILFGIIVGMAIMVYVLKDTRLVPDEDATEINVTKMRKNGRTKLFVTVPKSQAGRVSFITGFAMWTSALLIKISTIKKLHFINSRRIRVTFSIVLFLIVAVLLFNLALDTTILLPDGQGGYGVYKRLAHK
jgi:hypothetical protein